MSVPISMEDVYKTSSRIIWVIGINYIGWYFCFETFCQVSGWNDWLYWSTKQIFSNDFWHFPTNYEAGVKEFPGYINIVRSSKNFKKIIPYYITHKTYCVYIMCVIFSCISRSLTQHYFCLLNMFMYDGEFLQKQIPSSYCYKLFSRESFSAQHACITLTKVVFFDIDYEITFVLKAKKLNKPSHHKFI